MKTLLLLLLVSACTTETQEPTLYACKAQVECWPHRDQTFDLYLNLESPNRESARKTFGAYIHEESLTACNPNLYNTLSWDCAPVVACSELGCEAADYSLQCVATGNCACDPDARGPAPEQQCYPDK